MKISSLLSFVFETIHDRNLSIAPLLLTEMKRISEVLQLAVKIERGWAATILEPQLREEVDFLRSRICVQRSIFQKGPQSRFLSGRRSCFLRDKFEPLQASWSNFAIQENLQAE